VASFTRSRIWICAGIARIDDARTQVCVRHRGARDGTVRVWEAESGRTRFVLQGFTAYLGSLQVSPTWLLADGTNNAVVMLDFTEEAVRAQEEEEDDEDDDDDDDDDDGSGLLFGFGR